MSDPEIMRVSSMFTIAFGALNGSGFRLQACPIST